MANRNLELYRSGWNPLSEFHSLHRGIDRLFDDVFNASPAQLQTSSPRFDFNPAVDVEEEEDHYLLSMDLPGVKKDDVKIEILDNQLIVSGERKDERREDTKNRHFVERSYGKFQRTFALPLRITADKIEADFDNGVLRIAVPKEAKAQSQTVQIGGAKTGGLLTRIFSGNKSEQSGPKKVAG